MLRVEGPKYVDLIRIDFDGLEESSLQSVVFHLELEHPSLQAGFFGHLCIRGHLEDQSYTKVLNLLVKISEILNKGFTGTFIINNELFTFEVEL